MGYNCGLIVDHLPSMHETLGSISSSAKKKKKEIEKNCVYTEHI
jgi:hypothetical protein